MVRVRYGAGGVEYIEKDPIEKEQPKAAKAEKVEKKKKKKKVIQEIMGDDLKESKEMLDEII